MSNKQSSMSLQEIVLALLDGTIESGINKPLGSPFWQAVDQAWRLPQEQAAEILALGQTCLEAASSERSKALVESFLIVLRSRVKLSP